MYNFMFPPSNQILSVYVSDFNVIDVSCELTKLNMVLLFIKVRILFSYMCISYAFSFK